jgi:hypothetical protein
MSAVSFCQAAANGTEFTAIHQGSLPFHVDTIVLSSLYAMSVGMLPAGMDGWMGLIQTRVIMNPRVSLAAVVVCNVLGLPLRMCLH